MSLLDNATEPFNFIDKSHKPDGEGGHVTEWIEGAEIQAAARLDTSMQAKIAEKQGVTSLYTIITKKDVTLEYHDVIRRKRDGKVFRITSDGEDSKTPEGAVLNMRQVSAEEWELTT